MLVPPAFGRRIDDIIARAVGVVRLLDPGGRHRQRDTCILSILFGLALIWAPGAGGMSVSMMIGAWALMVGILRVLFAFRVRSLVRRVM